MKTKSWSKNSDTKTFALYNFWFKFEQKYHSSTSFIFNQKLCTGAYLRPCQTACQTDGFFFFAKIINVQKHGNWQNKWGKVFKSGLSKFCGRQGLRNFLSPLLNTLSQMYISEKSIKYLTQRHLIPRRKVASKLCMSEQRITSRSGLKDIWNLQSPRKYHEKNSMLNLKPCKFKLYQNNDTLT